MKLFCRILIGLMVFSSCLSNGNTNSNAIIGTWKTVKEAVVYSTKVEQTDDLDS